MLTDISDKYSLRTITTFIFLVTVSILFTIPIGEGDFFWHLKTGQWIWENKSIPTVDPFSSINQHLAMTEHTVRRTAFILKQYWLGQLAFYGVWKIAGEAGMVMLRMLIYSSILLFIYRWLAKEKGGYTPLVTIFFIGNELKLFGNERPQIFAYFFFLLLVYLLERLSKEMGRDADRRTSILLALLMLAWGNSHGSFILGVAVIALYITAWVIINIRNRSLFSVDKRYPLVLATAIFVSAVNPNGFLAFQIVFDMKKRYAAVIGEYVSPVSIAIKNHMYDGYYWIPLLATFLVILLRFRKMELRHTLTLGALALLSTTAIRYIPFFMLATPLLALNLPLVEVKKKFALIPLALIIFWASIQSYKNTLKFRADHGFPSGTVTFLNKAKPEGNLFNTYGWGGYLMFYTDYKVFVDGRALAENFTELQQDVLNAHNWQGILSYFKLNTIVTPGTDEQFNMPYQLMWALRNDDSWVLVFQDRTALVFVRRTPENSSVIAEYKLDKSLISKHLQERRDWQAKGDI